MGCRSQDYVTKNFSLASVPFSYPPILSSLALLLAHFDEASQSVCCEMPCGEIHMTRNQFVRN